MSICSRDNLRDNLLVTMGARAAYMDAAGHIDLPDGSAGEAELAAFVGKKADEFLRRDDDGAEDVSFDEFIETALAEQYAVKAPCESKCKKEKRTGADAEGLSSFSAAGLELLDRLDEFRRENQSNPNHSADVYMRVMEGMVAEAFGFKGRNDWTRQLKENRKSRYYRDLQDTHKFGF